MNCVMIIDDSEADQYLAKDAIEEFDSNIKTLQAYDGQEALEILKDLPVQPDVIFLDINMPRMNGHEFLAEYDVWDNAAKVIIMLTSSEQEEDKTKSIAYRSVLDYFTKPLSFDALKTVHGLLKEIV